MEEDGNYICKFGYYQIRKACLFLKYMNGVRCNTLIEALVICRLDCGNALSVDDPFSLMTASRLETGTGKRDHLTTILFQFH